MTGVQTCALPISRLLAKVLGYPVSGWRWDILWATAAGVVVGVPMRLLVPPLAQLVVGIPLILGAFGVVLWTKGFHAEDRVLFRMRKVEVEELRET